MPAITLGFAEVEERLRALRRRLNAVSAQHGVYVSLSAVIFVATALIVLGLRASASMFRVATWTGACGALGVVVASIARVRRRWVDLDTAARFADQRSRLSDRLRTLMDLRARPRSARLAPVLVAQTLALGAQWQVQRLAPRRVPRSVFALVGALLALASTAFVARREPPPSLVAAVGSAQVPGRTLTSPSASASTNAAPSDGGVFGDQGMTDPSAASANGAPQGARQRAGEGESFPPGQVLGAAARSPDAHGDGHELKLSENTLAKLPDQLQQAIRRAFHAPQVDQPPQLAARGKDAGGEAGQHSDADRDRREQSRGTGADQNATGSQNPRAKAPGSQNAGDAPGGKQPGKPKPGEQAEHRPDSGNQNFEGASPQAGDGSSPGGLMDGKATATAGSPDAPKTFKLTITSFLHALEQQGNQPRKAGKRGSTTTGSAGLGGGAPKPLSEHQLNDDVLRKAEIPPEYEDLLRRVYSARADQ